MSASHDMRILLNAKLHFSMKNFNTKIVREILAFRKYRQMGIVLTLFAFLFVGDLQAQGQCSGITFSFEMYEPCKFRARYDNSTDCFTEIWYVLETGSFSSWSVNSAAGFTLEVLSSNELHVKHLNGFLPLGNQVPLLFTLPPDLNTTMHVSYLDNCAMVGCEIVGGIPIESCPDPQDAHINGVKYRECGSLPYTNQPTISGWTIQLLNADSNVIAEQVTDVDGAYAFYDLPHGTYTVQELSQNGWTPKVPLLGKATINLDPSEQKVQNFGNCPGCSCDSITTIVQQASGIADTSNYYLSFMNSGAYCFPYLEIQIETGQLLEWTGLLPGWDIVMLNNNLLRVTPPGSYLPTGAFLAMSFKVYGTGTQSLIVTTGTGNLGCAHPFQFTGPPSSPNPMCCPNGTLPGSELVVNGDFSTNTLPASDYIPNYANQISIKNQNQVFNSTWLCTSKTGPFDNFLVIDGIWVPGKAAWKQQVSLTPNSDYVFCAMFNNMFKTTLINTNPVKPIIEMWIENNSGFTVASSGAVTLPEIPDVWVPISVNWTSPGTLNGPYTLKITTLSLLGYGNDFAIDCISFVECSPPAPCGVTISANPTPFCGTGTLTANPTGTGPFAYQWSHGQSTQSINVQGLPCGMTCSVSVTCADGSVSSASYTVSDNVPPVAVCNLGTGVDLGAACIFNVTPAFVDGGSTDNCAIQSMSVSPTVLQACTNTIVTLTVTDWCGNMSTCTMGIQTIEGEPPLMTCPPNTIIPGIVGPNGLCTASFSPSTPVATDNCDPSVTVTNDAPAILQLGPNTITWTATDDCGNQTVCTQIVTVECDECCKDEQAFFTVASAVQTNAVYSNCFISANGTGLNDCMRITWDWGDGSPLEGPYANNTPVSHTYSGYGLYTVCYTITEVNQFGEPCFEAPFCLDKQVGCFVPCPDCPNNIVQNPGFLEGAVGGELGFIGASDHWMAASATPDISAGIFCCDAYGIQMWGSQDKGEAICQSGFNFIPSKTYSISFSAYYSQPSSITPYVQFGFYAANGCVNPFSNCTGCETMGISGQITDENCATFTLPNWTPAANYNSLIIKALTANPWPALGFGRIDNICIQEVEDTCYCGSFSDLYARPSVGASSIALSCGGTYNFGCPNSGQSIPITGKFECQGTNCPATSQINWTLEGPNGGIINGTMQSGPYFYLPISPIQYAKAGFYKLTLQGNCGGMDCPPCIINFNVDCPNPCPCDVQQFQKDVAQGFATALWTTSCKACFSPLALNDCDIVEWKINGGPTIGMTNGDQYFCHTFPGAGTYTVTIIVTRKKSDGLLCEVVTFSKSVTLSCIIQDPCDDSVFPNATFSEGAIAGGMQGGGMSLGWGAVSGNPVIVEGNPESIDGWSIQLSGNLDTFDILGSIMPICLKNDTGLIKIRIIEQQIQSENQKAQAQRLVIQVSSGDSVFTVASITFPEFKEIVTIDLPRVMNDFLGLGICNTSNIGVLVQPRIYVTNELGSDQGGESTYSYLHIDNFCFNGTQLISGIDMKNSQILRIYPNPNPGTFSVELPEPAKPEMMFRITDLAGRLVQEQATEPGSKQQTVQAGLLPPGLYFLQVVSEGKVLAVEKFVKE